MTTGRDVWLTRATSGALGVSLALALFTPLYTDEIGWRFQLARAPFDGGVDRYIAEACASPMIAAPWFLQPLRYASAWGNALLPDPAVVRLVGVAMAVVIVALLALGVRRAVALSDGKAALPVGLLAGVLGLGLLPFLLVWSRPEQPILLCLAASVAIALWRPVRLRAWLAPLLILLLGTVALGYHLKAIFYLPVFVAALFVLPGGGHARRWQAAAAVLLVAAAATVYPYWSERFLCPGDPVVAATHRAENLGATLAAGGGVDGALIGRAVRGAGPASYILSTLPGPEHMSGWVAPTSLPPGLVGLWRVIVSAGWWLLILGGVVALIVGMRRGWRERRADPRLILAGAIGVSVTGWSIVQLNSNAYEAALWLPLAALASLLAIVAVAPPVRQMRQAALATGALALTSQMLLWADYARLIPAAAAPGFIAGRPFSINPYGYDAAAIRTTGRLCGIADDAPRVVIDDWTYFAYLRNYRPIYAIGSFGRWRGSVDDPIGYLRAAGSPGVVTSCQSLPDPYRRDARRNGSLCCLAISPASPLAPPPGSARR